MFFRKRTKLCLLHGHLPETLLFLGSSVSLWSPVAGSGWILGTACLSASCAVIPTLHTDPVIPLALMKDLTLFIWEISAEQELLSGCFSVEKLPPVAGGRYCKSNPLPGRNLLNIISYNEIILSLLWNDYNITPLKYHIQFVGCFMTN